MLNKKLSTSNIPVGSIFTDLTVVRSSAVRVDGYVSYECKCTCGKEGYLVAGANLIRGHIKSCGCRVSRVPNRKQHGASMTLIYGIWRTMKNRCQNANVKSYEYYGGRGITVSEPWQKFENFYADMGDIPEGKSLDRVDNSKGYSKENCRWATKEEQANNKRNNVFITFNGETLTTTAWARRLGIHHAGMQYRLANWTLEKAMTEPIPDRPRSKLTDEQVYTIRKLALTRSHNSIAIEYNVSRPAISAIVKGKTYRDLL